MRTAGLNHLPPTPENWSGWRDWNPRPDVWKTPALPLSYSRKERDRTSAGRIGLALPADAPPLMGDLGPPSANGGSVRASALLRKYGWPGLNRHGLRNRQALDLVRLPIPPHPREILPIAGVRFGVCLPPSPAQPWPIKGPFCARSRWWTTALARRRLCPPPRHRQRYSPSRHLASTTCDQGNWCRGPDSDRHALNAHEFLRLACLPIPSPRQNESWSQRTVSNRQPSVYETDALNQLSYAGKTGARGRVRDGDRRFTKPGLYL